MNRQAIAKATNPDLRASLAAMRRAAAQAREIGVLAGTGVVVTRDGKPTTITASALGKSKRA